MNIAEKAFNLLYAGNPEKLGKYDLSVSYSGHFREYGATISMRGSRIEFRLSKSWHGVDEDIRIGLLQELLVKLFKTKITTMQMDFYNSFLRNLHKTIEKSKFDPVLKASFDRVNERYFMGMVEMPNLSFGQLSTTKLGSYDFRSDTIKISQLLDDSEDKSKTELLDYVMYHEMLHKKHSFTSKHGKNRYHTSKFRTAERIFENSEEMEHRLSRLCASAAFSFRRRRGKYVSSGKNYGKRSKGFFDWLFG